MGPQTQNLNRVRARIGYLVMEFFQRNQNREFHAMDLRHYIDAAVPYPVAPGSETRVMRDLRIKGQIDYRVIDRRGSLYLAL